eukprot:5398490-Pyramimonas_sp.AAC.1
MCIRDRGGGGRAGGGGGRAGGGGGHCGLAGDAEATVGQDHPLPHPHLGRARRGRREPVRYAEPPSPP